MSSLIVEVCLIDEILPHTNADKLEIAMVKGWHCVVGKDQFKKGDKCVYIPIDSVLPDELVNILFANSKIQPDKGRIRTIKIRGLISQGLLVNPDSIGVLDAKVGDDVAELLRIKKYEPPKSRFECAIGKQGKRLKVCRHPLFDKYTDIENYKNYNAIFEEGEPVVIMEKIHGTNFRAGYLDAYAYRWWQKLLKMAGMLRGKEFVYGSHNVQLRLVAPNKKVFYEDNVYLEAVKKYQLKERTPKKTNIIIYGEVYGTGIQTGYEYGLKDERRLLVFDIKQNGVYLDHHIVQTFCNMLSLPIVPCLYEGPFKFDIAQKLSRGPSVAHPEQKHREGVVIKPTHEVMHPRLGRKILKLINDDYLMLKNNSDFH